MIEYYERPFVEASDEHINQMIVSILITLDHENNVMWTDVANKDLELFEELMYERILRN